MSRGWRIRTPFRELRLEVGHPRVTGDEAPTGTLPFVAELLFELERGNAEIERAVTEMQLHLGWLEGTWFPSRRSLGRRIEDAVRSGELVLREPRLPPAPVLPDLGNPAPDPPPSEDTQLTFIEIELRDDDDAPVSAPFILELGDGEVRQGYTSVDGRCRIDDIKPGTAKVTFPDYADPCVMAA